MYTDGILLQKVAKGRWNDEWRMAKSERNPKSENGTPNSKPPNTGIRGKKKMINREIRQTREIRKIRTRKGEIVKNVEA
jgi:hypothetical protein